MKIIFNEDAKGSCIGMNCIAMHRYQTSKHAMHVIYRTRLCGSRNFIFSSVFRFCGVEEPLFVSVF